MKKYKSVKDPFGYICCVNREEDYLSLLGSLKQQHKSESVLLTRVLILRVFMFVVTVAGTWLLVDLFWLLPLLMFLLGLGSFLVLVKRNETIKFKNKLTEERISLIKLEINALKGDISAFGNGSAYRTIDHPYDHDLDILGDRSFFQSLNRTGTKQGENMMANWLLDKHPMTGTLKQKQEALKELSEKLDFRQTFYLYGKIYDSKESENRFLAQWFNAFKPNYTRSVFFTVYKYGMPIITIGALILNILGLLPTPQFIAVCMLPLAITGSMLKKTNLVYAQASDRFKILAKAGRLLGVIEKESVSAELLDTQKRQDDHISWSSQDIRKLDGIMNAFDSRLNPFVGILLNIFLAWDVHCLVRLERWVLNHKDKSTELYNNLAWWDAMCSLGTYVYNHPQYVFPVESESVLEGKDMGHPFLPEDACVLNDFKIDRLGHFSIITGANMAGKSTFLRTVGLSLVMARLGLPVRASEYKFKPVKLYTSMRTTDSLQENESYFYTELKRLKGLVSRLDSGEQLFIILDEILKGTNSKDKAEGSQRFIEKLLQYSAAGIIATHDLSLTSLGDKYDAVENKCFEVEFGKDDLIFDYKLKPGVCKNMNATWLLEKMKLV